MCVICDGQYKALKFITEIPRMTLQDWGGETQQERNSNWKFKREKLFLLHFYAHSVPFSEPSCLAA